jgi:hypothetical protein
VSRIRGIITRKIAELEIKHALVGHDVQRGATMNHAGMDSRVGHVETAVVRAAVAMPSRHLLQEGHRFGGSLHRVDAKRRISRMRSQPAHRAAKTLLALVRDYRPHFRGFADDAGTRPYARLLQITQQTAHPQAADLFVITEC